MFQSVTPKIERVASSENYGRFVVEPLESGFGVTLGNALRRVLLSSLPGAAVKALKIEGVEHEFSAIPHVKEDTIELLLNVKQLRLRPLSDRPGKLTLEVAGQGRVCAGDITPSADFEVVNPELHLATLDSAGAKLTIEFHVEQGKGYVPAGSSNGLSIGMIPVDSIFTPTVRVNYSVEKTRLGQVSNYNRLILEVWTDGTISPAEAVSRSAEMLVKQLSFFCNLDQMLKQALAEQSPIPAEQYDMPIEQLNLSARTFNCLRRASITKVGEVLERTDEELLKTIRNFGQKSLLEVRQQLQELGLITSPEVAEEELVKGEPEAEGEPVEEEAKQ